jgi:hypothetical protein
VRWRLGLALVLSLGLGSCGGDRAAQENGGRSTTQTGARPGIELRVRPQCVARGGTIEVDPEGPLESYSFGNAIFIAPSDGGVQYFAVEEYPDAGQTVVSEVEPVPAALGQDLAFIPRPAFRWKLRLPHGIVEGEYVLRWEVVPYLERNYVRAQAQGSLVVSGTC